MPGLAASGSTVEAPKVGDPIASILKSSVGLGFRVLGFRVLGFRV